MADADSFLASLRESYQSNDPYTLAAHLDPLDHALTSRLKEGLQSAPHLRPSSYASLTKTFFPSNPQFAEFAAAFLLFVRDGHPFDVHTEDDVPPESALGTFELFNSVYSLANVVLATQDPIWFVPSLRKLSNALSTLAFQADDTAQDYKNTQAGVAARLLTRSLAICAAERNLEWPSKRNATFFLANQTFKIYFKLNNLRMCDTVVKNTRDARDFLDTQFPKADRVTFSYYMGRMYLSQRRMRKAMLELRRAFNLCTSHQWKNRRLILVYLVTASLPLGVFPKPELLQEFELDGQYFPLIDALKSGNFQQCLAALNRWKDWHLGKGTYLLLREKLEVVCWRNLARRTLFVAHSGNPQPGTAPPTLPLKAFLATARLAFDDPSLDIDDVEAMCASLLDQGYVKAYIHQNMQILVLQKGKPFGFPPVSTVRMIGDEA